MKEQNRDMGPAEFRICVEENPSINLESSPHAWIEYFLENDIVVITGSIVYPDLAPIYISRESSTSETHSRVLHEVLNELHCLNFQSDLTTSETFSMRRVVRNLKEVTGMVVQLHDTWNVVQDLLQSRKR
jgi:hypothetical protein